MYISPNKVDPKLNNNIKQSQKGDIMLDRKEAKEVSPNISQISFFFSLSSPLKAWSLLVKAY